jgi:hypothetical protein
MRKFALVLVLTTAAFAACSESSKDGSCTDLENTAPAIAVTTSNAAVPTGTGGTAVEGTYHLTAIVRTSTSPMPQLTFRQTLRISGNTIESADEDSDKPAFTKVSTFTTNGSSIVFSRVCSTEKDSPTELQYNSYTADATHVGLYSTSLGFTATFTKQP